MRITQKMIFDDILRHTRSNRAEMARIQSSISSGVAVRAASQDPIAFERSRIIKDDIRKNEQYQSNISSGLRQARMAQEALDESIDNLIEVKRILTLASSDTQGPNVRETLAGEIAGIRDNLLATLNVKYGDRHLFAGTNSESPPFQPDVNEPGGVANYSSSTPLSVRAGDNVTLDISVTGTALRDTGAQAAGGDLFGIIQEIEQALLNDDSDTLRSLLPDVDKMVDHVTNETARLGTSINRLEFMFEQYESSAILRKAEVSEMIDTDYAQAFSDLQRNQIAFEGAMAVHSYAIRNTLMDYL